MAYFHTVSLFCFWLAIQQDTVFDQPVFCVRTIKYQNSCWKEISQSVSSVMILIVLAIHKQVKVMVILVNSNRDKRFSRREKTLLYCLLEIKASHCGAIISW